MGDFRRALSLLTRLPVRARWDDDVLPGRAMAAYPLVGAVIGVMLAGLAWLLTIGVGQLHARAGGSNAGLSPLLTAALILVAWAAITGMLHLDGWADCCDALVTPLSRERRLEVMKDPRLGSFGGAGLILLLIVKLAAVAEVLAPTVNRPLAGLLPLLVVPVLGRWAVVIAAASFPLARPDGMGASFGRGLGQREVILATLITAVACLLMGWGGLVLWAAAVLALLGMARLATARLGGLTGDVYGAIVELTETVTLVAACLLIGK
jgi:adenosylcobinamide-GDP ribazoletransferase